MKPEEAIEIAIHCLGVQAEQAVCEECPVYLEGGVACREVARAAIYALKEIQQYREIGTVEECREARERRWIPVEKEWPPFGQRLQATILHHEWIADYDSYWVPEEEKTRHPAYMEVCEIYPMGEMWCYSCEEDKYEKDIAYINPAKVLSRPVAEIIAWRQLPELYRSGKDGEKDGRS